MLVTVKGTNWQLIPQDGWRISKTATDFQTGRCEWLNSLLMIWRCESETAGAAIIAPARLCLISRNMTWMA